jgi:muramoyltetrapeptide carboxypeptidase LdcA involved in peptidoglycan recycling
VTWRTSPPKPNRGDRVAVVSPSAGLPGILPAPFELGLRRLTDRFGLVPVEYPTTRTMHAPAADRAADLHAAFADPRVKAVIATIGGDDQITVLPHLDAELLRANPKSFFGFSDNTCLLAYLYEIGLVAYHGGMVMTEFGRSGRMHPMTEESVRAALFTNAEYVLPAAEAFRDIDLPSWDDPGFGVDEPDLQPCDGWAWHNADLVVDGPSWGGNLELLAWLLMAGRVGPSERYAGHVLLVETSEELPGAVEVYRILRNMGERGLLRQFPAVLVARAKAWSLERRTPPDERETYRREQRDAVRRAFAEYAPHAMLVFDVDIGHTDPQLVLPYGGRIRVDGPARTITVTY